MPLIRLQQPGKGTEFLKGEVFYNDIDVEDRPVGDPVEQARVLAVALTALINAQLCCRRIDLSPAKAGPRAVRSLVRPERATVLPAYIEQVLLRLGRR
jgi:hypothetical protein